MTHQTTIDQQELSKFAQHAKYWWDSQGPLRTLHDINPARLQFITDQIPLKNMQVLDVGCGGGILCEAMSKLGALVSGIDAEPDALAAAQTHALTQHLNIDYQCTPIEEFEGNTFDIITCMEMLEHVPNPQLVLEHCKRLLKPGGIIFLSTINRTLKAYGGAILVAEYILNLLPKQTHDYEKFIKPSELMTIARSLGFNLKDMKGIHYNPLSRVASLCSDVSINYLLALI